MPQSSSSHHSTESAVKAPHRRTLGDDGIGSSTHSTIPNGDPVVSTEDDGPMDLFISAQLPTTNGLGGVERRISKDDEKEGPLDLTIKKPLDLSTSKVGPQNGNNSDDDRYFMS